MVAHFYRQSIVAHIEGDVAISHLNLMVVIARVDLNKTIPRLDFMSVITGAHLDSPVPGLNGQRLVALVDGVGTVALLDHDGFVALIDGLVPVILNLDRLIMADPQSIVILNRGSHVLFGTNVNEFTTLFVFETNFVEVIGGSALGAARLDAALRHVAWQSIGWHLFRVIDSSRDDGLIGIPFQEIHNYFLANARIKNSSPLLAGPNLCHAHPAGGVFVLLSLAIPEKLHFHPAVLIHVNFLAAWPDDNGGLRAGDGGMRGQAQRPKRHRSGNAAKRIRVMIF